MASEGFWFSLSNEGLLLRHRLSFLHPWTCSFSTLGNMSAVISPSSLFHFTCVRLLEASHCWQKPLLLSVLSFLPPFLVWTTPPAPFSGSQIFSFASVNLPWIPSTALLNFTRNLQNLSLHPWLSLTLQQPLLPQPRGCQGCRSEPGLPCWILRSQTHSVGEGVADTTLRAGITAWIPINFLLSLIVNSSTPGQLQLIYFSPHYTPYFPAFFACLVIFDLTPDIVNFTLLDARYFCIPINILELLS